MPDVAIITQSIGAYVPNIIGALVILIVGWLIALIVSSLLRSVLRRTTVDDRLGSALAGDSGAPPVNVAEWIATGGFWLIMAFVLIAFFQTLSLTVITNPLNQLLGEFFTFLPRLLGALVLALVAWIVATVLRLIVVRGLQALRFDQRVSSQAAPPEESVEPATGSTAAAAGPEAATATRPVVAPSSSPPLSRTLGDVVYWLVFLLFLPLILSALQLEGLLTPVQALLNNLLGFLPNIIAAVLIAVIGWFVARIVQRIVTNLLAAAGVDRFSARLGLDRALGQQHLSSLLGLIVYILILIPVLIAALDALHLGAVTAPASDMLNSILTALPLIFAAGLVLVIAWVVGRLVSGLATNLLRGVGFDTLPARLGLGDVAATDETAAQPSLSEVIGLLVLVGIMLFAAIQALQILGFAALAALLVQFTQLLGRIVLGLIIVAIGLYLANLAARAVRTSGAPNSDLLARVAQVAILALAGAMALRQIGVANEIINLAFGLLLGAVAVAAALAFGLGGREAAARQIEEWRRDLNVRDNRPGSGAPNVPPRT